MKARIYSCNTHDISVWTDGVVDDANAVVPRSSPLRSRVAVSVGSVSMTHVVLPRSVVDVAVVIVVATVTHALVLLPAACQRPGLFMHSKPKRCKKGVNRPLYTYKGVKRV